MDLTGKKLIFLGGSGLDACAIRRAKELGVTTIVANRFDEDRSPAKRIADEAWKVDFSDIDGMVEKIRENHVDGIFIGWTDSHLPHYVKICEKAGLPCCGTEEQFDILREKGWDVGRFSEVEPGVPSDCFLRVNVSYYKNPPIIHYIANGVDTLLDESRLSMLDRVNFERLDIRASEVNKQKMDGTWVKKPFVLELWATVTADRFMSRYSYLNEHEHANPSTAPAADDSDDEEVPF